MNFFSKKELIINVILFFVFGILITSLSFAQTIPGGATVGSEQEAIKTHERMELFRKKEAEEPVIEKEIKSETPISDKDLDKRISIKKFEITGCTITSIKKTLDQIAGKYINREVSFKELLELTDKLTAEYRKKGYITSEVVIPPQTIENGVITLKAFEGTLDEILLEGNRKIKKKFIDRFFRSVLNEPLNAKSIYKLLIKLQYNPDLHVKAVILAGTTPGTSRLNLKIKEDRFWHTGIEWDNLGNRFSGRQRLSMKVQHSNVSGHNDSLTIRGYRTSVNDNFSAFTGIYTSPLDAYTQWGIGGGYVESRLGKEYKTLSVKGRASEGYVFVRHDFHDGQKYDVSGDLRFELKEATQKLQGDLNSHDSLRILTGGIDFTESDGKGKTYFRTDCSVGFSGFLGAMHKNDAWASRTNAGGQFIRQRFSLVRIQRLIWDMLLMSSTNFQYTPDTLVTSEEFRLGGAYTVRGYPEGDSLGDKGYNSTLEIRTPFYFIPKTFTVKGINARDALQFVAFLDYGRLHTRQPQSGEDDDRELLGTGCGMRIKIKKNIYGRFDIGWPLGDKPANEGGYPHIHFAFGIEF